MTDSPFELGEDQLRIRDLVRRVADERRRRVRAAPRAEAVDEPPTTERIDCDSPRVDLGGESELSARIDALFRVKRSPALAAQLNMIYEHHESIPRYTT